MSLESTVSVAKPGVKSVRATVPEGIVAFLDLKVGDKLVWKMDFTKEGRIAIVTKKHQPVSTIGESEFARPRRARRID